MATLAAQTSTELAVLISSKSLIDWSRQRSATATVDQPLLDKAASHAAVMVESYLGDNITDTDVTAVDLSTRLAALRLSAFYSLRLTDAGEKFVRGVMGELKELAERRALVESNPTLSTPDFVPIDKRYPATRWEPSA